MTKVLGPEWDSFERDGHTFVRDPIEARYDDDDTGLVVYETWTCKNCGSQVNTNNYMGLPDDSYATLEASGHTFSELRDFDDCATALALTVHEVKPDTDTFSYSEKTQKRFSQLNPQRKP